MMSLNKVMLIGNLTRDPELRTTPAGQSVATIGLATNFSWTDQSGQKQDKAEFHNVVLWRKLAEIATQYLKKGSKVYFEGRIQTRTWDDQAGVKRYRTEIIADTMIMLDRPQGAGQSATPSASVQTEPKSDYSQPEAIEEINVEDIPF
jgi:single-strand DNA-binding protein